MTFWTLLMRCLTSECVNRRTRKYSHTPRLLSTQYLETLLPHSRSRCVWEPWRWLSQILSTRLFCSLSTLGPCYRSVVSPLIIIDNLSHRFAFENMLIETNRHCSIGKDFNAGKHIVFWTQDWTDIYEGWLYGEWETGPWEGFHTKEKAVGAYGWVRRTAWTPRINILLLDLLQNIYVTKHCKETVNNR